MRKVEGFLSAGERQALAALSSSSSSFVPGRQGTGYEKLALRDVAGCDVVVARARALLGLADDNALFDAWLLRYPRGSGVPAHVDAAAADDHVHVRVNAVVVAADAGGVLAIDGAVVDLAAGDAVVFRPDVEVHAVSVVDVGERVVFSVGALVPNAAAAR